jgi:hypothetical protein
VARNYAVSGNATNTASATLPLLTLISAASIQPKIHDLQISSDAAPADHAAKYLLQRCTTAGTPGSSLTPQALDPSHPSAATTSGLAVFGGGPTLTANAFLLAIAVNQRVMYRWACKDGKEITLPATASNGVALMCTVVDSAFNAIMVVHFEE